MPVPPYLDDEGTRPSHVRFARDEQHIYPRVCLDDSLDSFPLN